MYVLSASVPTSLAPFAVFERFLASLFLFLVRPAFFAAALRFALLAANYFASVHMGR